MSRDIWSFVGVPRSINGETDQILNSIFNKMFEAFNDFLNMSHKNYTSIEDMIHDGINKKDQYSYFWDWFNDHGIFILRKIAIATYPNFDETLDCLEDRLYIIESDINNGLINSIFDSIADTFTAIDNLINSYEQQAVSLTIGYSPQHKSAIKQYIVENPVESQQGFIFFDSINLPEMLCYS